MFAVGQSLYVVKTKHIRRVFVLYLYSGRMLWQNLALDHYSTSLGLMTVLNSLVLVGMGTFCLLTSLGGKPFCCQSEALRKKFYP